MLLNENIGWLLLILPGRAGMGHWHARVPHRADGNRDLVRGFEERHNCSPADRCDALAPPAARPAECEPEPDTDTEKPRNDRERGSLAGASTPRESHPRSFAAIRRSPAAYRTSRAPPPQRAITPFVSHSTSTAAHGLDETVGTENMNQSSNLHIQPLGEPSRGSLSPQGGT